MKRNRVSAGLRLLIDDRLFEPVHPSRRRPDIAFDLIRPDDLVALSVEGYGMELVIGPKPHLRPKADESSRLVIGFAFQNLAEEAIYEEATDIPDPLHPTEPMVPDPFALDADSAARPVPPICARPARATQLVFDVPEDAEIPFTTEGILEAMSRLPMVVHPLARPKAGAMLALPDGPILRLPGGLIARIGAHGLVLSKATGATPAADPSTAARNLRRARAILAESAGVVFRAGDAPSDSSATSIRLDGTDYTVPSLIGPDALARTDRPFTLKPKAELSRSPRALETAIEAPFRLVISPSKRGGWSHATTPVRADQDENRIELWHSRLGVRVGEGDSADVDERKHRQRIVRAVWARDREKMPNWQNETNPTPINSPFRTSLTGADRHMLVRQTSETWLGKKKKLIAPTPVDVEALWLSSLGAWLDLHGMWDTMPYSEATIASILTWDHIAPMGRDQFVRVTYPGYLFPFGHKATLVKITERKMKDASPSIAGLYQRKFIVVNEPVKVFSSNNLPLTRVRLTPVVTPNINDPDPQEQTSKFFPMVDGSPFPFLLDCQDQEGRPVRLATPLLWVAERYNSDADLADVQTTYANSAHSSVAANGQEIAFAEVHRGGDTMLPTHELKFAGEARLGTSDPLLKEAAVEVPAVQHLSPVGWVRIKLADVYVNHGFGAPNNPGEVWAELVDTAKSLSFGGNTSAGSDRAGGFIQPDLPIRGLSRIKGTVGDVAGSAKKEFNPAAFLSGVMPKLFGLVSLVDLLDVLGVDLDDFAPAVVSEALDSVESFLSDLDSAKGVAEEAVKDAQRMVQRAQLPAQPIDEVVQKANETLVAAQELQTKIDSTVTLIINAFDAFSGPSQADVSNALNDPFNTLRQVAGEMRQVAALMPPLIKKKLLRLSDILTKAIDAADVIEDIFRFVNGLASGSKVQIFRFEWTPKLKSWPDPGPPVLKLEPDSLVLAVEGRTSGKDGMGVNVLAELRDFSLILLPGAELVSFAFDHISFRGGSDGKAEVDVVINDIKFLGMLSFVEVLKELIPLDGFSDPPYLEVSPSGITAGFSLALPNIAVGVFNLSNISLGADVQVPFLGSVVTVGFNFCTRERPFALAVSFIGGGGWFLIRLSPDGLEILELGLEAGAMLAIDFGVASGSISAMLGIYMRLEGTSGSLTGYFRLRGEVDVLGLISASIELYLGLVYQFETGKMVGKAKLTIKVEVLFFSVSVTIEAERRFAGSNGDPSFADVMVLPDGSSPAWNEYCAAFAGA